MYMSKLVEGFSDDLEKLRTVSGGIESLTVALADEQADPTLGADKLSLLIESLASGQSSFSLCVN